MTRNIITLIAIVACCLAASASAQSTRATWEYRCITNNTTMQAFQDRANALGADGWELVLVATFDRSAACFKRPK